MIHLAEWFVANQIPLHSSIPIPRTKSRGSLKHYFNELSCRSTSTREAGLDMFIDCLSEGAR